MGWASGCLNNTINASSDRFAVITGGGGMASTLANAQTLIPTGISINELWVYPCGGSPGTGPTIVVTIEKGSSDTAVTCTINSSSACSITGQSVSFAAQDLIALKIHPVSTPSVVSLSWFVKYTPTIDGEQVFGSGSFNNLATTGNNFQYMSGNGGIQTNENSAWIVMPTSGTLKKCVVNLATAPGSGITRTAVAEVSGVDSAINTFSWANTNGIQTDPNTVSLNAGDRISLKWAVAGGTATASVANFGCVFAASNPGDFVMPVMESGSLSTAQSSYLALSSAQPSNNITEPSAQTYVIAGLIIKGS